MQRLSEVFVGRAVKHIAQKSLVASVVLKFSCSQKYAADYDGIGTEVHCLPTHLERIQKGCLRIDCREMLNELN